MKITKTFMIDETRNLYNSIAEAKRNMGKKDSISRVWIDENGNELGSSLVWAYGESVGTIMQADEQIVKALNIKL